MMNKLSKLVLQILSILEEKPIVSETDETAKKSPIQTKKEQVLEAILHRAHEVNVEDLPRVEAELLPFFEEYKNGDYFNDLLSKDYYRLLDMRDNPDKRVVIIGDIHCDFMSLAALLLKLSVSSYNYYEEGIFVFMGDYLDRGTMLFEPLLLLMDLKRILGERMIMLRGNHELIDYDAERQELEGRVIPMDSVPCLNEYCGDNKAFLEAFGYFYKTLPTYLYLKVKGQNILITHGGVPRDIFLNVFKFDQETGALVFEPDFLFEENSKAEENVFDDSLKTKTVKLTNNLRLVRNKILYDMIWGDPSSDDEKYQVAGRYQFGRKQFEAYAKKNALSRVFRSHEPVDYGFSSFFENRLFTIFSTGGRMNEQSGYCGIEPAFAVVNGDGTFEIENSYIYRVDMAGLMDLVIDPCSEELLKIKYLNKFMLNEEFGCSVPEIIKILSAFVAIKKAFSQQEETPEAPGEETDIPQENEPATVATEEEEEEEEEVATDTEESLTTLPDELTSEETEHPSTGEAQ